MKMLDTRLTMGCTFGCAHCYEAADEAKLKYKLSPDEILSIIPRIVKEGIEYMGFNGGEPMLCWDTIKEVAPAANRAGLKLSIFTNGYWATNRNIIHDRLEFLKENGLTHIFVSYDDYHKPFSNYENVKAIIEQCEKSEICPLIYWCGDTSEAPYVLGSHVKHMPERWTGAVLCALGRAIKLPRGHTAIYWEELITERCGNLAKRDVALLPGGYIAPCCTLNPRLIYKLPEKGGLFDSFSSDPAYATLEQQGFGGLIRMAIETGHPVLKLVYRGKCEACCELMDALFPRDIDLPPWINDVWPGPEVRL